MFKTQKVEVRLPEAFEVILQGTILNMDGTKILVELEQGTTVCLPYRYVTARNEQNSLS